MYSCEMSLSGGLSRFYIFLKKIKKNQKKKKKLILTIIHMKMKTCLEVGTLDVQHVVGPLDNLFVNQFDIVTGQLWYVLVEKAWRQVFRVDPQATLEVFVVAFDPVEASGRQMV